jgi:acyl-CoA thioesterase
MLYSEVLGSLKQDGDLWTASVPDDWKQGRSLFGGVQSALALRAMRALVPAGVPLRVLQTTFAAPVPAGTVRLRARVLRAGKNAVHAEAHLVDGDQTLCVVVGVFGTGRASKVEVLPQQPPVPPQPPIDSPFIDGLTPEFTQFFTVRWLLGGLPGSGTPLPRAMIEVRMRDSAKTGEEHVVAIADAIPPVAMSMLTERAAGSSMTWTLEMLRDHFHDLPLTRWRLDAEVVAARDGYTNQSVMVWGPGGEPVALSSQCMVVFG